MVFGSSSLISALWIFLWLCSLIRCPQREMKQHFKRKKSCNWPLPCPKVRLRRRSAWWVAQLKCFFYNLLTDKNC